MQVQELIYLMKTSIVIWVNTSGSSFHFSYVRIYISNELVDLGFMKTYLRFVLLVLRGLEKMRILPEECK